jgi:hypothetical protein
MKSLVRLLRPTFAAALAALAVGPVPAHAANDFAQKPEVYICPNSTGNAVECYLEAVRHLYTMCRQVKSIEILEFGYALAEEGVNSAKTEYCVDKHKLSITRYYQAALRAATQSSVAVETLRALQDFWQKSLVELKWHPPESDDEYKARVATPYDVFTQRAEAVRAALASARTAVASKPAPAKSTAVAAKPAN